VKDAELAISATHWHGAELTLTDALLPRWREAIAEGHGDDDVAVTQSAAAHLQRALAAGTHAEIAADRGPHRASTVTTAARAVATLVSDTSGSIERQIGVEDMKTTTLVCGGLPLLASQWPALTTDIELYSSAQHSAKESHDLDVAYRLSRLHPRWAAPS
jgi:hypothetical protein